MRKVFFNVFLCSFALFLHAVPYALGKSHFITYDAISSACGADIQRAYFAKEDKKESDKLANDINLLFLTAGVIKEAFSSEQIHTYLSAGHKINKEKNQGLNDSHIAPFIALGANVNYKPVDALCKQLSRIKFHKNKDGYAEVFEIPAQNAVLNRAKDARIDLSTKEHVSRWKAQYPIHFEIYVNETGLYELEIEYNKNKEKTSNAPLRVYAATGLDKASLANASQISDEIPSTADNSWDIYRNRTVGLLRFEAGKKYYLVFADTNMDSKKNQTKEVISLHKLWLKGAIKDTKAQEFDLSYDGLSGACIIDYHDLTTFVQELSKEKQVVRLAQRAGQLSGLYRTAGVTKKSINSQQMLDYNAKGFKIYSTGKDLDYGDGLMVHEYVALALGFDLKKIEETCNKLRSVRRYNHSEGYNIYMLFRAQSAYIKLTKGAKIKQEINKEPTHVSNWMSGYPVIFKAYIDKTGEYEVEIKYSKSQQYTSTSPLRVYAVKGDRNSPNSNDVYLTAKIPHTAQDWKTYKKLTLGKLHLEANNFYTFYLADEEIKTKKDKNVMALQEMVVRLK